MRGGQWLAVVGILTGLLLIIEPWNLQAGWLSNSLGIGAAICWAMGTVLVKKLRRYTRVSLLSLTAWSNLIGSLPVALIASIANEPPVRDSVALSQMAMQRLGKDVVDLENVTVSYGDKTVLKDVTWRIAPGERTGILGVNGAGKSTLLSLVSGSLLPTTGRVKRGKTIKVATLTQQLFELEDIWNDRVSEVIGRQKSTYVTGGKEMTPGQLLERVGFSSAQLSTPVKDLSGGQKRRLQLLLILLLLQLQLQLLLTPLRNKFISYMWHPALAVG